MLLCIETVAGTGAAAGFELVRVIVAPPAGAAAVSCTATQVESPLNNGFVASVSDTGEGGAELTANVPVVDHAVTAAVWAERPPSPSAPARTSEPTIVTGTHR